MSTYEDRATETGAANGIAGAGAASRRAAEGTRERVLTEAQIADFFWRRALAGQHRSDLAFHSVRWAYLLQHVEELVARAGTASPRILDIGVSLQTDLLRHNYPGCVDSLDIDESETTLTGAERDHLLDLNDLFYADRRPALGPYDVIVMCEVIEHLHTSSAAVLSGVASWLAPGGHLFVQTPNAAALHKRVKLLAGRNPYMDLSEGTPTSPPHFREYTMAELTATGRAVGLEVVACEARNYFRSRRRGAAIYNDLCERLPPSLRAGLSITYRRPPAGPSQ